MINRFRKRTFFKSYLKKEKITKVHNGNESLGEISGTEYLYSIGYINKLRICVTLFSYNIPYFIIFNGRNTTMDTKKCRISMIYPKFMNRSDENLILSDSDILELSKFFNETNWRDMIEYINNIREDNELSEFDINLPIPDYSKLK